MILIYLCILIATALFAMQFFETDEERQMRLALNPGERRRVPGLFLFRLAVPFVRQLVPFIARLPIAQYREKTKNKLITAGLQMEISADEFIAFRMVLPCYAAILPFILQVYSILVAIVAAAIASFYPRFWLSGIVERRKKEILRELPYFIDLLTLSVEAGLDFQIALRRVVQRADPSALRDEFHLMLQEIKMGKTRAEALRALARRVDIADIKSFAAVLIQADQLGASIGAVLRAQADKMRTERFQRAEKAGAQAATKVLIPIMLFILPSVFLLIFGAFLLSFLDISGGLLNRGF